MNRGLSVVVSHLKQEAGRPGRVARVAPSAGTNSRACPQPLQANQLY